MYNLEQVINSIQRTKIPTLKTTDSKTLSAYMRQQMRIGEFGERKAKEQLEKMGYRYIGSNRDGRFDMVFRCPKLNKIFTVEVKYHPASERTGNLFYELYAHGEPSDLFSERMDADLVVNVYYTGKTLNMNILSRYDCHQALEACYNDIADGVLPRSYYVEGTAKYSDIVGIAIPIRYFNKYSIETIKL